MAKQSANEKAHRGGSACRQYVAAGEEEMKKKAWNVGVTEKLAKSNLESRGSVSAIIA